MLTLLIERLCDDERTQEDTYLWNEKMFEVTIVRVDGEWELRYVKVVSSEFLLTRMIIFR